MVEIAVNKKIDKDTFDKVSKIMKRNLRKNISSDVDTIIICDNDGILYISFSKANDEGYDMVDFSTSISKKMYKDLNKTLEGYEVKTPSDVINYLTK